MFDDRAFRDYDAWLEKPYQDMYDAEDRAWRCEDHDAPDCQECEAPEEFDEDDAATARAEAIAEERGYW